MAIRFMWIVIFIMIDELIKSCGKISSIEMIDKMLEVESMIGDLPDAKFGDDTCPLKHSFADGLYVREIFMPKGMLIVSALHKTSYPFFVLEGDLSIITLDGLMRIKAPYYSITQAGTKRILYIIEDTHWITVHATEETDVDLIREKITAKRYSDLPDHVKEALQLKDKERDFICHSQ